MFHLRPKRMARKVMNMEMPDMNMHMDMPSVSKVVVASALVYWGTKMLMEELMD